MAALPGWAYANPALIVEAQQLRTLGCAVCVRAVWLGGEPRCGSGLKLPSCKRDKRQGYRLAAEHGGEVGR